MAIQKILDKLLEIDPNNFRKGDDFYLILLKGEHYRINLSDSEGHQLHQLEHGIRDLIQWRGWDWRLLSKPTVVEDDYEEKPALPTASVIVEEKNKEFEMAKAFHCHHSFAAIALAAAYLKALKDQQQEAS